MAERLYGLPMSSTLPDRGTGNGPTDEMIDVANRVNTLFSAFSGINLREQAPNARFISRAMRGQDVSEATFRQSPIHGESLGDIACEIHDKAIMRSRAGLDRITARQAEEQRLENWVIDHSILESQNEQIVEDSFIVDDEGVYYSTVIDEEEIKQAKWKALMIEECKGVDRKLNSAELDDSVNFCEMLGDRVGDGLEQTGRFFKATLISPLLIIPKIGKSFVDAFEDGVVDPIKDEINRQLVEESYYGTRPGLLVRTVRFVDSVKDTILSKFRPRNIVGQRFPEAASTD